MKTFEHFPKDSKCPICGTNDDRESTFIPKYGTQDGNNCQAILVHVNCIFDSLVYYPYQRMIACNVKE